ncbi:Glutamate-gated chloride channel [Folsomia candida]|uniref:Glutamate-gated chloride channel n=1 Tax=Folsomia candida TaxID=158441 RepID=A0A226DFL3_FOLCA|nr:Glutamate-gated chloride channel [Folsomia candida]
MRSKVICITLSCQTSTSGYFLMAKSSTVFDGWTTEDLIFKWKPLDPVQVTSDLHLPRFALEEFTTDYCDSMTNTGTYSCLRVDLLFKREFSYYLIQIYIPCCMLVIVSWVSFWLDQSAVPARVSLGVTTLLTMATQTSGINQTLPPVSYTKALDVWTGVCLTFVFGALLEFALVNYASRSDQHRENVKKQRRQWELEQAAALEAAAAVAAADHMEDGTAVFGMKPIVRHPREALALDKARQCEIHMAMAPKREGCARTWLSKFPSRSKRIDVVSRITFPLIFALFNLAYWCAYLLRKDDSETHKD